MTSDFATLTMEQIGFVRRITLNRPDQHNPLTPRCVREILRAVSAAEVDEQVRVLIIRGTGRSFSSGYGYRAEDVEPGDFMDEGVRVVCVSRRVVEVIALGRVRARAETMELTLEHVSEPIRIPPSIMVRVLRP